MTTACINLNAEMYHMSGIVAPSVEKLGAGHLVALIDSSETLFHPMMTPYLSWRDERDQPRSQTKVDAVIAFDAKVQTVRRYEQG